MGFELPEIIKISKQMEDNLIYKKILDITLTENSKLIIKQGMSNLDKRKNEIIDTKITSVYSKGKWIFLEFENKNILMLGEIIGRFSYLINGESLPPKYHFLFKFDDGSNLIFQSSLYAFLVVANPEEKKLHRYAGNIGPSPNETEFTREYFLDLISQNIKKPIKAVLNLQDQISGIGNVYINDILFEAKIHPKTKVLDLTNDEINKLYDSIVMIIKNSIELGGSNDECDLYGNTGRYKRLIDKNTAYCERCKSKINKENILGSSSYYCPNCQKLI